MTHTRCLAAADDPGLRLVRILPQAHADQGRAHLPGARGQHRRKRASLKMWQAYELRYEPAPRRRHRSVAGAVAPGAAAVGDAHGRPARYRDHERRLGRASAQAQGLLLDVVGQLLESGRDEALEALHDKYSDVSHEEARQSEIAMAQSLLSDVFGLDIGDDHGATTRRRAVAPCPAQARGRAQGDQTAADEESAPRDADPAADNPRRGAALARREQAAKDVSQSLRDVYRKLASAPRITRAGRRRPSSARPC